VDNQHLQIAGYRDLTQCEIDIVNEIKAKAEEVGILVARLESVLEGDSRRWASIAKTDLQKGFMALVRAVARPTTF
jgi:hypothetical protein